MIHIQYEWLSGLDIGHLFQEASYFITIKGNKMIHSPFYSDRMVKREGYDEFGTPQPPTTDTVRTWYWKQTDLSTGKTKDYSTALSLNNGWQYLVNGPSELNWRLGNHMIIGDDKACPYEMDGRRCFGIISSTTQQLLKFLSYDCTTNDLPAYYCSPFRMYNYLPHNMAVMPGNFIRYENYYWKTNHFVLNGKQASYEDLLRWSLLH